jgi:hypothetical protein
VVVNEDTAAVVSPQQPRPLEGGDQEAGGSEDGGQLDLEEPEGEHA